jgi:hypothetical protein
MKLGDKTVECKLNTALYRTVCKHCDEDIDWTIDPDPDGPTWSGSCGCAGNYTMSVVKVQIRWGKDEDEDDDSTEA